MCCFFYEAEPDLVVSASECPPGLDNDSDKFSCIYFYFPCFLQRMLNEGLQVQSIRIRANSDQESWLKVMSIRLFGTPSPSKTLPNQY